MSTVETTVAENASEPAEVLLFLLPEEIDLDPVVEIRGTSDGDLTDEELKESLKLNGQAQPCLVRPNGKGGYRMVAGHRRREQIYLLNLEAAEGTAPRRVLCVSKELTDVEALRNACAENLQRKNMNAMQEARLISKVREQFGWKGGKNSRKVAEFLGRSPAWVTEREKLLTLDAGTQEKILAGKVTSDAALVLPAIEPGKVDEVLAEATELQMAENAKKGQKATVKDGKVQPVKLMGKHVKAAARNKAALKPGESKSLNKGEILDFFGGYRGSIPHLYAPVQEFLIYFLDKFVTGKGSSRTAEQKFEAMIAGACKGPKCEAEKEEEKPVKVKAAKAPKAAKAAKLAKPAKVKAPKPAKAAKPAKKSAKKAATSTEATV